MASPADRQTEAEADVERIARKLYEALCETGLVQAPSSWHALIPISQHYYRATVRKLLLEDTIRVGHRPNVARPLEGQTTIDEIDPMRGVPFEDER